MKESQVVLVTGGSKGIGAAIVNLLLEKGYKPLILDVIPPMVDQAEFFEIDLSQSKKTRKLLKKLTNQFTITRLVNNVGIVRPSPIDSTSLTDFKKVMQLNAQTALLCTQAVLPSMQQARFGRIVNITTRAVLGKELRTAYVASKGAIGAMTRTWALELASSGITVNAIAPGPIETEAFKKNNPPDDPRTLEILKKIPLNRMGKPSDVAYAVNFFLDEASGFITGQTLYVCGGITVGLSSG